MSESRIPSGRVHGRHSAAAVLPLCILLSLAPAPAFGQAKDAFVEGLVALVTAVEGTAGDEGPAVLQALRTMEAGLAEWDRAIAAAEMGMSAQIGSAAPEIAGRMRTALGVIYLERGRFADALIQLDAAAAGAAVPADVHLFRGWALRGTGRTNEAAGAFLRAVESDPANPMLAYLLLHHARFAPQPAAAVARATATIHAAEAKVDTAGARDRFLVPALLDDAGAAAPLLAWASYRAGYELVSRGRYEEAIQRLRAASAADPLVTSAVLESAHGRAGAAALRAMDLPRAVAAFEAAVEENPRASEPRRLLGLAHWMAGQYEQSASALEMAIRLEPLDERARMSLADVLFAAGRPQPAEQVLVEALRAFPRSGQAHWRLARLYQATGREREAVEQFEAAAATEPLAGRAALDTLRGRILENHFEPSRAIQAFVRAVDVNPNDAVAHRELAEALQGLDRLDEARAEFVIALLLDPADVAAWTGLGQVHAAEGRLEAAVQAFQRALGREPRNREARYALARTLLRLGKTAEGQQELGVFERLQKEAMEEERRRYLEALEQIERAVQPQPGPGAAR